MSFCVWKNTEYLKALTPAFIHDCRGPYSSYLYPRLNVLPFLCTGYLPSVMDHICPDHDKYVKIWGSPSRLMLSSHSGIFGEGKSISEQFITFCRPAFSVWHSATDWNWGRASGKSNVSARKTNGGLSCLEQTMVHNHSKKKSPQNTKNGHDAVKRKEQWRNLFKNTIRQEAKKPRINSPLWISRVGTGAMYVDLPCAFSHRKSTTEHEGLQQIFTSERGADGKIPDTAWGLDRAEKQTEKTQRWFWQVWIQDLAS